jgi:hypothetical protein
LGPQLPFRLVSDEDLRVAGAGGLFVRLLIIWLACELPGECLGHLVPQMFFSPTTRVHVRSAAFRELPRRPAAQLDLAQVTNLPPTIRHIRAESRCGCL